MSRVHSFSKPSTEVASYCDVPDAREILMPAQVVEGDRGVVVLKASGRRIMHAMRWGFPGPAMGMDEAGTIGLVADITNPLWEETIREARYRCIIPITHFANPEGEPGRKTRTWFSVKDQPVMAWAGICRRFEGAGPAYAGLTMTANDAIPPTNDRMPLLLERDEVDRWLHGSVRDVIGFQFRLPFAASRMDVARTDDLWRSGAAPPTSVQTSLL